MLLVAAGLALSTAAAAGRAASDDLVLTLALATGGNAVRDAKTTSPFQIAANIDSTSGVVQTVTLRIGLPDGLRWGNDAPDPSEGCTEGTTSVCTQELIMNAAGTVGGGWFWDVVADHPGTYALTASVAGEQPDPDLSNNTATIEFEVTAAASATGGRSSAVSVSAVKRTPAKPQAGRPVTFTASVKVGGVPAKPSRVTCAATLGGNKTSGTARAAAGSARCRYATPRSARGKRLAGKMTIVAQGKTIGRRFAVKLR
jgi:hypothetical protein